MSTDPVLGKKVNRIQWLFLKTHEIYKTMIVIVYWFIQHDSWQFQISGQCSKDKTLTSLRESRESNRVSEGTSKGEMQEYLDI